jgi:hypothetical protein
MKEFSKETVARAIDAEPELPGPIPERMWNILQELIVNEDKAGMAEAMRIIVRETKNGIRDRLGLK